MVISIVILISTALFIKFMNVESFVDIGGYLPEI